MSSQRPLASSTKKPSCSCCALLLSGGGMNLATPSGHGKPLAERADSDHHSLTGNRASTVGGLGLDLDDLDDDAKNPSEMSAVVLEKIAALKGRLQSRVGTLKHNVRQVALAEKDVKEIIALLGAACSEYQFLHSRGHAGNVPGNDPLDLANDPLFTDAAHAISRVHGFYSTDSAGDGTGTGHSGQTTAQRNERKAFGKSPGPSARRSQMFGAASPTNGESKNETPRRSVPVSARSAMGKHATGTSTGSTPATTVTTIHSVAMPKLSLPIGHDSPALEPLALGRLQSIAGMDELNTTGRGDDTGRSSASTASGSGSSRRHGNDNGSNYGNSNGQQHIELEQLTVQR